MPCPARGQLGPHRHSPGSAKQSAKGEPEAWRNQASGYRPTRGFCHEMTDLGSSRGLTDRAGVRSRDPTPAVQANRGEGAFIASRRTEGRLSRHHVKGAAPQASWTSVTIKPQPSPAAGPTGAALGLRPLAIRDRYYRVSVNRAQPLDDRTCFVEPPHMGIGRGEKPVCASN